MTKQAVIPQEILMEIVLPLIKSTNLRFKKIGRIKARTAIPGEQIVSITSDGHETTNTANAGDFVVSNNTEAEEEYIVSKQSFDQRYEYAEHVNEKWNLYYARGEILAIAVDIDVLDLLDQKSPFLIMASWGSPQTVRPGDYLASPAPSYDEIYRIAKKEFSETYQTKTHER